MYRLKNIINLQQQNLTFKATKLNQNKALKFDYFCIN